jgi:hypothetical protein
LRRFAASPIDASCTASAKGISQDEKDHRWEQSRRDKIYVESIDKLTGETLVS